MSTLTPESANGQCNFCRLRAMREQTPTVTMVRVNLHDNNGPVRVFVDGRFVARFESLPRACTC